MNNFKRLFYAFLFFFLLSCSTTTTTTIEEEIPQFAQAHKLLQLGKIKSALELYQQELENVPIKQRAKIYIQISGGLYDNQQTELAYDYFNKIIPTYIQKDDVVKYKILQSLVEYHNNNNTKLAYESCPQDDQDYHYYTNRRIYMLKIILTEKLNKEISHIYYRIKLDKLLLSGKKKNNNLIILWDKLLTIDKNQLLKLKKLRNQVVKKWIDLALLVKDKSKPAVAIAKVNSWFDDNPDHPADSDKSIDIIYNIINEKQTYQKIAVFLPFDKKFNNISTSILDGIKYSMEQNNQKNQEIKVYDSSQYTAMSDFFNTIKTNNIDFVIGPLQKNNVQSLSAFTKLPVPFLALNYDINNTSFVSNLYQFGLVPEDEIKTLIDYASSRGKNKSVALLPNNSKGHRIGNYLSSVMKEHNGVLLSIEYYNINTTDFEENISRVFSRSYSNNRANRLREDSGLNLKPQDSAIQHIDFVYVFANHQKARQIIPQIRFYRKRQYTIFASSTIYNNISDAMVDDDVKNVIFAEIPWNVRSSEYFNIRKGLENRYGSLGRYSNFYALGFDAFYLVNKIRLLKNDNSAFISGATGTISMNNDNKLHRRMIVVQMKKGHPVAF
jgi:uncharacterized protein